MPLMTTGAGESILVGRLRKRIVIEADQLLVIARGDDGARWLVKVHETNDPGATLNALRIDVGGPKWTPKDDNR